MIGKPYKKTFVKNPIAGTKFTIAISSAKVVLENQLLQQT